MPSCDGAACKACASMAFSIGCGKIAQAPCALSSLGGNRPGSSSTESDLKGTGCSMFSPAWFTLLNGIQLYPDKGPKVRAARAKGKGKQKGQGQRQRQKGRGPRRPYGSVRSTRPILLHRVSVSWSSYCSHVEVVTLTMV